MPADQPLPFWLGPVPTCIQAAYGRPLDYGFAFAFLWVNYPGSMTLGRQMTPPPPQGIIQRSNSSLTLCHNAYVIHLTSSHHIYVRNLGGQTLYIYRTFICDAGVSSRVSYKRAENQITPSQPDDLRQAAQTRCCVPAPWLVVWGQ